MFLGSRVIQLIRIKREITFWRRLFMSIGKSKAMSMVSLLAAGLVWVGLLGDWGLLFDIEQKR